MKRRGQSTTEYMLVIAVISLATLTVVHWLFADISRPLAELGEKAETVYTDASIAN